MREYVQALRAIWQAWATGERLAFEGEFYRHTLMTPFFTPDDHGHGPPAVWLAAVGPRMTEVTGEVADGLLCHGFSTARYLEEVTLPRLAPGPRRPAGSAATSRWSSPSSSSPGTPTSSATGGGDGQGPARLLRLDPGLPRGARSARLGRAARGTAPALACRRVGEHAGPDRRRGPADLRRRRGPPEVGTAIRERYGHLADRISLATSYVFDEARWQALLADLRRD
jgi:hypothetical protein